nr:immunoglobulin light chain junction region [Macaca mulatta]MOV61449.1 immunoglobulin light chain junction region [Macaca mulatta]MOV61574.1 immunoglobulin light chain junction region [Macaca mulatta]MOV61609.1 immunoglobulin light chain junction region [Macaca mulatta]MOV62047.1 immunoglobulin light chain junction region [Macaca mulatta]
CQQHHNYPRTF